MYISGVTGAITVIDVHRDDGATVSNHVFFKAFQSVQIFLSVGYAYHVISNNPIALIQVMASNDVGSYTDGAGTDGDPCMVYHLPVTSVMPSSYHFHPPDMLGNYSYPNVRLMIVVATADRSGIRIDGARYTGSWKDLPTIDYSVADVALAPLGLHHVGHVDDEPLYVIIYGYGMYAGYVVRGLPSPVLNDTADTYGDDVTTEYPDVTTDITITPGSKLYHYSYLFTYYV